MAVIAYVYAPLEEQPVIVDWRQAIDQLYADSGAFLAERPQLQQLLQDCAEASPHTILVRHIADLGSSPEAVMNRIAIIENQGNFLTTLDQSYQSLSSSVNRRDPNDLAHLITAIQAQHQSTKLRSGHARNRLKNLPPPGRAPYGYRRGRDRYALDRSAAPVVRAFFEHFLLYGSIRGAARHLSKTYGKQVSASTGQRWLTHPVYRGDLTYQDGSTIQDTHTAIITRDEAAQIDRLLRRNRRLPSRTASAPRSLAGLIECQECHSKLQISRVTHPHKAQEYVYLRPSACGRTMNPCKAIPYQTVLTKTIEQICRDLPQASALGAPALGTVKGNLVAEIEQKEAALTKIASLLHEGVLDAMTANLRTHTLRSEMAALKQAVSQLPPANLSEVVNTLSIPQFWHDLSESERRDYLREFIHTIAIVREGSEWSVALQFLF